MTDRGTINTRNPVLLHLLLAIAAASLACTLDVGGPEPPQRPASIGEDRAGVDQTWESALAGALQTGELRVLLDEAQLTALLSERLSNEEGSAFESPVVLLRDGTIQVYGVGHQGPLRANVHLTITPVLNQDGDLGFELTSAEFGPLPLPEGLRDSLSALLTEALSGPLGTLATGVKITSVAIDSGELAIVGELR